MHPQPPRWTDTLLRWFCAPRLHEEVQGDLHELYGKWVAERGVKRANQRYVLAVLGFIRPFALKQNPNLKPSPPYMAMLQNYLTVALRNLQRQKTAAIINISGLAIGISACLVIYLIASYELGFDTFHPGRDRIYRVYSKFTGAMDWSMRGVHASAAGQIRNEFTGLEAVTGFHTYRASVTIPQESREDKVFNEKNSIVISDPDFFRVIQSYRWLAGSPDESLSDPFRVVLTESRARTYFGSSDSGDMLGRTIRYNDSLVVSVSGIVADLPEPTDFTFTDFISLNTIRHSWLKNSIDLDSGKSTNSSSQLFIRLAKGTDIDKIQAQVNRLNETRKAELPDAAIYAEYQLQPLSDLHFNATLGIFDTSRAAANRTTIHVLIGVAVFLLLIATVNFVNLVTAQAVRRAKEVGVRKVLGSTRNQLMGQFLSETLLLTGGAVLLSVIIAQLTMHYFAEFIPEGVVLRLTDLSLWLFLLAITALVSLLAGLYPAFVLSSFAPVRVLKNQAHMAGGQTRTAMLRKGLIVFQFSFAQLMIVGTLVVAWQLEYMLSKDMGFEKDEIIYFYAPWEQEPPKGLVLQQELLKLPQVTAVSMHGSPPAMDGWSTDVFEYNTGKEVLKLNVHQKYADTAYLHLYNIPLLAGRNLIASDTVREYLINETYARQLGFTEPSQAIGSMLRASSGNLLPVVGVVADFHVQSLHTAIPPVVIFQVPENLDCFGVRVATRGKGAKDLENALAAMGATWQKVYPDDPFRYEFLDETIARFYESEQRTGKLMVAATGIAIFISCLGLFGLITYAAVQRTKEIGIRKVLGASVTQIVGLLSRDFLKLVLLANIIAWPIAWYALNQWLENFVYRISLNGWIFALAGLAALVIAVLTMSAKAFKAASANPVESLRSE